MKSRGASVPEIALAFAVTEARVYQRLALAGLPEPVLDALAAGEISLGTAKAFTFSDDEALTLSLPDQVKGQAVSESAIKNALHPDAIKATDRRAKFVGIDAYETEGGTVTRDLFSDEVFLASPALLDRRLTRPGPIWSRSKAGHGPMPATKPGSTTTSWIRCSWPVSTPPKAI